MQFFPREQNGLCSSSNRENNQTQEQGDQYYIDLSQSIPNDAYVALDCEMVGVGEKGRKSVLGNYNYYIYKHSCIFNLNNFGILFYTIYRAKKKPIFFLLISLYFIHNV